MSKFGSDAVNPRHPNMTPNNSLQADKGKLSRHLRAHMARQLAFAAKLSR